MSSASPRWDRHPVALGTNTDPYQRAEGRYRLMPGVIEALAESRTPFSILTKGTLLRRDLPLLAEAAKVVPVDLAMSIAVYDDALQQSVEPGTPTTSARLATVRAIRDAGLDCSVFLMPVLPYITDTRAHLDDAIGRATAAGATSIMYSALHLRARRQAVVVRVARPRATRPGAAVPRDVPRQHLRAEGLPPVAVGAHPADPGGARRRTRAGRPGDGLDGLLRTANATGRSRRVPQEQSVPTVSPLKRADPGFDRRLLRPAAAQTLF